jgi:hypothetical protein
MKTGFEWQRTSMVSSIQIEYAHDKKVLELSVAILGWCDKHRSILAWNRDFPLERRSNPFSVEGLVSWAAVVPWAGAIRTRILHPSQIPQLAKTANVDLGLCNSHFILARNYRLPIHWSLYGHRSIISPSHRFSANRNAAFRYRVSCRGFQSVGEILQSSEALEPRVLVAYFSPGYLAFSEYVAALKTQQLT